MAFINSIISIFTQKRLGQIDNFKANPIETQRDTLKELLRTAQNTEYGQQYDFHSLTTPEQYRERLPIVHYEDINELIRANHERQTKYPLAGRNQMVCQIVRNDGCQEQVYSGFSLFSRKLSFPGR